MRVRRATAAAGNTAVCLIPALLLCLFVASGTVAVVAATAHRPGLMIAGTIGLVGSIAVLVLWLIRRDRRMRRGEWSSFERDFWSYVDRSRSDDQIQPPAEPPSAP